MGFFKNLFKSREEKQKAKKMELGLKKTKSYSFSNLKTLLESKKKVDDAFLNELEEVLILSDMGMDFTNTYMEALRKDIKKHRITSVDELKGILFDNFYNMYKGRENQSLNIAKSGPTVYLFMGVNGSGKTTSIAKLAYRLKNEGKKVLLAAGDTFRAAAREQLETWGERLNIPVVSKPDGSDPTSVIFDAMKKAKAENYDYLLCDTAGRLQTKVNLMKELEKIYRVIGREISDAPHEAFLVIDATTGQNGLNQAKVFNEVAKVSGVILTKLDGSSKGGVVLSISNTLGIPVKMYGFGEKAEDFDNFDIDSYLYSIFNGVLFEESDTE